LSLDNVPRSPAMQQQWQPTATFITKSLVAATDRDQQLLP